MSYFKNEELQKSFNNYKNLNEEEISKMISLIVREQKIKLGLSLPVIIEFDGKNFNIGYKSKVILNGTPKNPSIYKVEFNDHNLIIDIKQI